jgi:RPA family protein
VSDAPQGREVARRLFAAEFEDATLSYSEGEEERAPNYVVTPTGARTNRLFAVGALTEVESVSEDVLRGRVVDPTGAFVTYAGQYQPDAAAFLERAAPPCFVSLTGKARTYQPDDSDRIFTSVRPESLNEVDADTRDRWVVAAAEATLHRVATTAVALSLDVRGDDLRAALESRGVEGALAQGVALAVDHYEPTEHYLEAVRRMAVEALELVADERDSVTAPSVGPNESGPDELGPLPAVPASSSAATPEAPTPAESGESSSGETALWEESTPETDTAGAGEETATSTDEEALSSSGEEAPSADDVTTADTETSPAPSDATASAEPTDAAVADDGAEAPETEPEAEPESESADTSADADLGAAGDAEGEIDAPAPESDTATDDLGDFGTEPSAGSDDGSAEAADDGLDAPLDEEGMYELDEEEREEIESEYGTEFSTGNEVDEPGEADIDVPDPDELESMAEETAGAAEPADTSTTPEATPESGEPEAADAKGSQPDATPESAAGTDTAGEDDAALAAGADDSADSSDSAAEGTSAEDVDLEDAAVSVMADLDDGDGAEREAVVAAVVEEYGADPDDVEDAIQEALMGGKCYEPAEGMLKAI